MKRLSLFVLLLFCVTAVSHAQKQYNELEYPELNEFNKPNVETFTSDNGIQYFLIEDHELPLIDLSVQVRTGGVQVPNNKAGLASITGQVMRSGGTSKYPADSLNVLLENNAASMETGIGFTSGTASMNVLKGDFDQLLPVFVDLLANPAFPEEKVELAKKQNKSGISRRNDNAGQIASREYERLIYGKNSVYGRNAEYEMINNISRQDLVDFHKRNFSGKNMMVGVVGDFSTNAMRDKLEQTFSSIPSGEGTSLDFPEVDYDYTSSISFIDKPDVNQSIIRMGHIGGMRDNPDYAEIKVLENVLAGGFSGRLVQVIRTELGLSYSPRGSYGLQSFYPGDFFLEIRTKSESTAKVIDAATGVLKELQNEPISEEKLQDVKDQFLNSLVFRNTSYSQIINRQINNEYRGLPEDSFEQFVQGVKNTTVGDVQQMAQEYLHPDEMRILVVGNKQEIGDQLQKYGEVNEIDISIPQPGGDKEKKTVEGDAEKGQELLSEMADTIIAPGTRVDSFSVSGDITLLQQNQTVSATMNIDYPNNVEQIINTAGGTITMSLKDGKGVMKMAGNERTLPANSPQVKGLKNTLNRSLIAISIKAGELDPQFLGREDFEGSTYNKVNVNVDGKDILLLLDQSTNLPVLRRYQQFNPQQGAEVTVEDRYANWTSSGGITYAYMQSQYLGGNKTTEATYTSHSVNGQ